VIRNLALAISISALTLAPAALAGAATDSVKKTQSDLFGAIRASDDKKVEALFGQFIDFGAFAEDSLGSE